MTSGCAIASFALLVAIAGAASAQERSRLDGLWEGPWYRGMSSGKARFEIEGEAGTLQLSNAESFGEETRPLSNVSFDGTSFSFEARGGGGPLKATLRLDDKGNQMKGMGKYEGFGVRFELQRVHK
jgi:hypothetical protein